ncbi:MAG: hypothetical protein AAFR26_06850 [Cyanobacteria bacterium J06626_4]
MSDRTLPATTQLLIQPLEGEAQTTIVAGHSLTELGLQEMLASPSGMVPVLMSVAAALNELERWMNWVSFQSLTVQTVKRVTIVIALAPQGMPSSGLALVLMTVAVGLDGLERRANWGHPLRLAMPMVKRVKRTTVVVKHSVLIALGPPGMWSSGLAAVLMWVVLGLSWLEFEANWVSSLVLMVQPAALPLGHQLVAENLTAEVVPQVFGAMTWRVSPLAPVAMARQLMMLLFQQQVWRGGPVAPVLKV